MRDDNVRKIWDRPIRVMKTPKDRLGITSWVVGAYRPLPERWLQVSLGPLGITVQIRWRIVFAMLVLVPFVLGIVVGRIV